jgi:hypothetical protein
LEIAAKYIENVANKSDSVISKDSKITLLGTSGMKGIGKTELLKQIGSRNSNVGEKNVKSVYLTFNGGGVQLKHFTSFLQESSKNVYNYLDAFGQLLLHLCGIPSKFHCRLNFQQCLEQFRFILNLEEEDILLFLVDEIGHISPPHDKGLLHELMSSVDAGEGKLIFIFAHIMEEFLDESCTGSGREVITLPLPHLDIDIWKKDPDLLEASSMYPALHQLFLSCSGHPRSIFEGIPKAIKQNSLLLTTVPNITSITNARTTIINKSKFKDLNNFDTMHRAIMLWFSQTLPLEKLTKWKVIGLLHSMRGTADEVRFLFPLLVQDWALRYADTLPIAFHLRKLYEYDASLDVESEKPMEAVMYHYEAVLRIAQSGNKFVLGKFFLTHHYDEEYDFDVTASVPTPGTIVKEVENFSNSKQILEYLKVC